MIFIIILLGVLYFLFEKPGSIDSGILLDKRINTTSIDIKLGYGKTTKWIKVSKKLGLPEGIAYNVTLKGIIVTSIKPCRIYTGKVLERTDKSIVLDDRSLNFSKNVLYYKIKDHTLIELPPKSVIVGTSEAKFIADKNLITAVLVYPPIIKNIRVGISNNTFTSLKHYKILLHTQKGFIVKFGNTNSFDIKTNYLGINYKSGLMEIITYKESRAKNKGSSNNTATPDLIPDAVIGKTNKRIYIYSKTEDPIYADSLRRTSSGYTPKYYGNFEVFIKSGSMRLINEVNMEDYLKFVVAAEMISSGRDEGYKVQAIAARTYALSDMLSGRFSKYGFHVDDTTNSQAYNTLPTNDDIKKAVQYTSSEVMTYKGKIIDAKYYSTSCGTGAPYNEVWYKSNLPDKENPEPYLTFKNYSQDNIGDLSKDFDASNFLKDWTVKSYDSNSPYFRWKYTMDLKTLNEIINNNIYKCFIKNPQNYKKKWILGFYRHAKIPKVGIGKINDIYISKHGIAGNVIEMTIVSDSGTYKIYKEYNFKRLLISKGIEVTPLYGIAKTNLTILPSNFFVIDKEVSNNEIQNITIYGGGSGHGAGMSQYGTVGLVRMNKNYKDILRTFYSGIDFDNYESVIANYYK